jgi:hypothetical protein
VQKIYTLFGILLLEFIFYFIFDLTECFSILATCIWHLADYKHRKSYPKSRVKSNIKRRVQTQVLAKVIILLWAEPTRFE